MSDEPNRFCKDCRHFDPGDAPERPMCAHPTSVFVRGIDPVTGVDRPPQRLTCYQARWLRADASDGYCGREGVHWQPRRPPEPVGFVDDDPPPRSGGAMAEPE